MEAVDIDKAFDNLVLADQIESEKGYKVSFSVDIACLIGKQANLTDICLCIQGCLKTCKFSSIGYPNLC